MKTTWVLAAAALAVCAGCMNDSKTARPDYTNPAQEDPIDSDRAPTARTLYVMAQVNMSQGLDKQAEALLRRIIQEYPDYRPAYNTLAELQMSQRRIPEAMAMLEAGLKLTPGDPVLLNNKGMCLLIRRDFESALACFTQAAGIVPDNTRYRSNMATALGLLGRREEALALYEQILPKDEALENVRVLCDGVKPQ
ncbi:MAG: tetratricopeptide repeat protein [Planctomycetaceae bacterium]|nr:tetratricopeptide repeat protein [Planctomycetaceae bacterium]